MTQRDKQTTKIDCFVELTRLARQCGVNYHRSGVHVRHRHQRSVQWICQVVCLKREATPLLYVT